MLKWMIISMLKWIIIFVLLQVCLDNTGFEFAGSEFVKAFRIFRKMIHKPNMGNDFP